jgi:hypothetical protein
VAEFAFSDGMPQYVTKDSGARAEYASGMVRDTQDGKARFGLLRAEGVPFKDQFMTRVADLMTRGIEKYGTRNWEKADSKEEVDRFRESAERHLNQYLAGDTDEDHAAAVVFNLLAAETTEFKVKRAEASSAVAQLLGDKERMRRGFPSLADMREVERMRFARIYGWTGRP